MLYNYYTIIKNSIKYDDDDGDDEELFPSAPCLKVQRKARYCLRCLIYIALDIGISSNNREINNDTGNTTSDIKNMT